MLQKVLIANRGEIHVIPLCVGQCRLGASVCRLACRYGAPLW